MNITIEHGELLQDHKLKALIHALQSVSDFDRSVMVEIRYTPIPGKPNTVEFRILSIDDEAKLEVTA